MNKEDTPRYQIIEIKIAELVKGELYDDVENAIKSLLISLKRKCIVN